MNNRFVVKAAGESGMGVNSIGEILAKALKDTGLYIFGYREYPSLIRGGYASYQIDIADTQTMSSSKECDLLLCLSRVSLHAYIPTVRQNGYVIHSVINTQLTPEEEATVAQKNLKVIYVPAREIAIQTGGKKIMSNTVMLGVVWQVLGLDIARLEEMITKIFARKPEVVPGNIACLHQGYSFDLLGIEKAKLSVRQTENFKDDLLIGGNDAISLAAIACGVRAFYAYPMTPSSSILSYLASVSHQTGMLVKQIEDEISVANMAVGSMYAGARTLIATSGGGYDLMTEAVSLAGMIETPLVCVLAQRPGPATGLPTWTSASDLNLAVYGGHGEYTRLVLAASDIASCYTLTQKAFNLAEKYQIPVILLTEKQIAESIFQVDHLPANLPIERHIVSGEQALQMTSENRYEITPSGISPRWLPGTVDATYTANSDEHLPDGSLTENAIPSQLMYEKRLRKAEQLLAELPEPEIYGDPNPDISFIGWGSVKNTMLDAMNILSQAGGLKLAYLHYEYVYPIKTEKLVQFCGQAKQVVLIENNALGQLGGLISSKTGILFEKRLLKYDGRPFYIEDIIEYVKGLTPNAM